MVIVEVVDVEIVSRNDSSYILIPRAIVKSFGLKVGDRVSYSLKLSDSEVK